MKTPVVRHLACWLATCLIGISANASAIDSLDPPMLRYERASAMINDGQPLVRLDIWADGQAKAWFHETQRHFGEYTFRVAPEQLVALHGAIGKLETSDFNRSAIDQALTNKEQERRENAAKSDQPVTVFAVSDDTISHFGINPKGLSSKIDSRDTLSLPNLAQMSRHYKSIDALQRWQAIESLALNVIQQGQHVAEEVPDEAQ